MGLLDFFKTKNDSNASTQDATQAPIINSEVTGTQVEYTPTGGLLNLQKNNILDLTKYSPSLIKVRAAAGWDVNERGSNYDLDLCAFLLNGKKKLVSKVYYGDKSKTGIYLDGDNLTGEGDGDDENIYVDLEKIPNSISSIIFAVVIYSASSRGQKFGKVKNAYMRLVDSNARDKEICRFSLSDDGGNNTAVTMAELFRTENGWSFKALGEYSEDSIESLSRKYN